MRYMVLHPILARLGGALDGREVTKHYYHHGGESTPIIAKYYKAYGRQAFCVMGRRTTTPSAQEVARNTAFGQRCSAVAAVLKDPTLKAQSTQAFMAQRQYKTLRAYIWHTIAN